MAILLKYELLNLLKITSRYVYRGIKVEVDGTMVQKAEQKLKNMIIRF